MRNFSGSQALCAMTAAVLLATVPHALAEDNGPVSRMAEFVGTPSPVVNLQAMEALGLTQGTTLRQPWSDAYWADRLGSIANPYDNFFNFSSRLSWSIGRESLVNGRRKLREDLLNISDDELNAMSPAEKYDLLLGDTDFTLTKAVFAMIDELDEDDQTAMWSGICHGWAPASLTLEEPQHKFSVPILGGKRQLTFYPADIRGLASFLWAKSYAQDYVKVEGWQCKKYAPAAEFPSGRLEKPECFDVNPAFLHILMTNQIGIKKQGFIIDADFARTVQNHPVYKYTYSYFNPASPDLAATSLERAQIRVSDWESDPFSKHRSGRARTIVGVRAEIVHGNNVNPKHQDSKEDLRNESGAAEYFYTLELDSNGDIVGGEWLMNFPSGMYAEEGSSRTHVHPDIVWMVPDGMKAWSIADYDINTVPWNGLDGAAPRAWLDASRKAAANVNNRGKRQPQPLAYVVDLLLGMSRD
ncbi:MAG: hypothetical protein NDJ89_07240 [Oligoflexia bacterium]|nr:hypothetical protein [Oligoflexia bacterium]